MVKSVKCGVKGCQGGEPDKDGNPTPFWSDPDCASVAERVAELQEHRIQAHTHAVDQENAAAARITAEAAKTAAEAEKLRAERNSTRESGSNRGEKKAMMARPTIEESVSESDWSFFTAEWDRYVEATDLTDDGEAAVRHLWQACSDGLRRALHNDGARDIRDVGILLGRIKSLCVQRRNNLVNILTLQKMGQERDEGVLAFVARLNGQASLCDLNVVCSCKKVQNSTTCPRNLR